MTRICRLVRITPAVASLSIVSAITHADTLQPIQQIRTVTAHAGADVCAAELASERRVAPDFAPFTALATASQNCDGAQVRANADQRSEFELHTIHALGHAAFFGEAQAESALDLLANSTMVFTFNVDAPCEFVLAAHLVVQRDNPTAIEQARFVLSGPSGVLADEIAATSGSSFSDNASISLNGDLAAGEHQLIVIAHSRYDDAAPEQFLGNAFYRVSLAAANCLGDFDDSGEVGLLDLAVLLSHFGMQQAAHYEAGDFDGDDDVDMTDLAQLLARFGRTCSE